MAGDGQEALLELKEQLRQLRVRRRLSMAGLEGRAGLGHTTVSRALNGSSIPTEATVVALAEALKTAPGPLLDLLRQARPRPSSPPAATASSAAGGADAAFEDRYLRYLVQRHGQLSVVGLDLSSPDRACWPLDAAYLSLEMAHHRLQAGATADFRWLGEPDGGADLRVERAEQALAGQQRVLVRGLAGSGKTTLLQWLAVSAGRGDLPADLARLDGCVPFVLPLRTLVRQGQLPAPPGYLAAVRCPLEAAQPSGWADRVLSAGRGLLLVDGLDEVPQAQRAGTREWLRDLLAAYPLASFVVTTRPSAVPEGWLADSGFTELSVRPMGRRDVGVFVTRWHSAAAAGAATDQERAHLAELQEALQDTVRAQRDLAQLTTTPLLCALVCALHRDRRGHLPQGRMELYEAALSMLLVRRDVERDIEAPEGIVLTEHQSIQLLQRLAYWLIRNGQTEMDHDTALALIGDALPAMRHVADQGDAAAVLGHLVGRSGLLRTPTEETIDFVHRTFQDYLGAKAAIEARDLGLLVRHAQDDQWEDVLRMAVAHARPDERATLLRRLIARGDRTPKHRTRLHLLATACLESATELDPAIRHEVQQRAAAFLPPRSYDEARNLASVGPVILGLLPGPEGLDEDEAAAVIDTAALVGGDAALTIIKKFRTNTHENALYAIGSHWNSFDTEDYRREVLADILELPYIAVRTLEELDGMRQLTTPPEVFLLGDMHPASLAKSLAADKIKTLRFSTNSALTDLNFVHDYPNLQTLALIDCPGITDLSTLTISQVNDLFVADFNGPLEGIRRLSGLRSLHLHGKLPRPLDALPTEGELTNLSLAIEPGMAPRTIDGISRWPKLTSLTLSGPFVGLQELSRLPRLESVFLGGEFNLDQILALPPLPQVKQLHLDLYGQNQIPDGVPRIFPNLKRMSVFCYPNKPAHVDLAAFHTMADCHITVRGAATVTGIDSLPNPITIRPRPRS